MSPESVQKAIEEARRSGEPITFWSRSPWSEAEVRKFEDVLTRIDRDSGGAGFRALRGPPLRRHVSSPVVIGFRGSTVLCGVEAPVDLKSQVVIGHDSVVELGMSFFPKPIVGY